MPILNTLPYRAQLFLHTLTLGVASLAQGYGQSLGFQPAQIEF